MLNLKYYDDFAGRAFLTSECIGLYRWVIMNWIMKELLCCDQLFRLSDNVSIFVSSLYWYPSRLILTALFFLFSIAILNMHFGQRNVRKYYEKIDLAASREVELKSKTDKSIQLLKKMTQPEVDVSTIFLRWKRRSSFGYHYLFSFWEDKRFWICYF